MSEPSLTREETILMVAARRRGWTYKQLAQRWNTSITTAYAVCEGRYHTYRKTPRHEMLKVVEEFRPAKEHTTDIVRQLEDKLERSRAGEFETVYMICVRPNGESVCTSAGKQATAYEKIGMLTVLLHDACDAGEK